jgi:hypothetical protein
MTEDRHVRRGGDCNTIIQYNVKETLDEGLEHRNRE